MQYQTSNSRVRRIHPIRQKTSNSRVPEGAFAARLGDEASIKTKVRVDKGSVYLLPFSAAITCAKEEKLNVSVSQSLHAHEWGVLPMQTMYGSEGWDSYAWGFRLAHVVRTLPGKVYHLSFSVGDAKNSCEGSMAVESLPGKDVLQLPLHLLTKVDPSGLSLGSRQFQTAPGLDS